MNKVSRLVSFWPQCRDAVDVGQHGGGHAVPQVGNLFTEGFELKIGLPFGELKRADFELGLPYAFA